MTIKAIDVRIYIYTHRYVKRIYDNKSNRCIYIYITKAGLSQLEFPLL